ncbi:TP901 family phage tail tape measure protein [Escherichia coli]|nr:TP901 family phage tail tape measure protein [Escherichia coli]
MTAAGYIPRGQFGIVGENGPEIVNGPGKCDQPGEIQLHWLPLLPE